MTVLKTPSMSSEYGAGLSIDSVPLVPDITVADTMVTASDTSLHVAGLPFSAASLLPASNASETAHTVILPVLSVVLLQVDVYDRATASTEYYGRRTAIVIIA